MTAVPTMTGPAVPATGDVEPTRDGLEVVDLHAAHGATPVLRGISLTVRHRELAAVLGPSGCGKTTLLRVIGGFHHPTRGRVELLGRTLNDPPRKPLPPEARRVGYIPQDVALFPHLSVAGNIGFGIPRAKRAETIARLLELTDLAAYADRQPHQLSGGQQQRVALARALAPGPDLLLLDEPFSGLDAHLRARVRADVTDLLRRTGTTAILVTHDADEALAFADTITVMRHGAILQSGPAGQLHREPVDAHVARALDEANILEAIVDAATAKTVLGVHSVHAADHVGTGPGSTVLIRPRQLGLTTAASGATPVRVRRVEFRGGEHRLELEVDGCSQPLIAYHPDAIALGAIVHLSVNGPVHVLAGDQA